MTVIITIGTQCIVNGRVQALSRDDRPRASTLGGLCDTDSTSWRFLQRLMTILRRLHALQLFFRKVHLLVTEEPHQLDGNKTAEMFGFKSLPPSAADLSFGREPLRKIAHSSVIAWSRLIGRL